MKVKNPLLIISVVVIALLSSCDVQKKAIKNKTDRIVSELEERTIKRKGDTVIYTIPNIKLKDTIIYTVNRQGTTLRTVYNDTGNISQIECFSSLIEITERLERMTEEVIKSKDREKTEEFDSSFILYIIICVVILGVFTLFLMYKTLNKNTQAITTILNKIN
jgi:hypothetical protein